MGAIYNRVRMSVSGTPGTGTITLGSALPAFQSFDAGGVPTGAVVSYLIEDGTAWEVGQGTYTASGTTLARTTVQGSSNAGSAISASANAAVSIVALASDLGAQIAGQIRSAKTGAYTLAATDKGTFLDLSGGPWTLAGSAATVGAGWWVDIRNTLPGVITFTPSSGTVDGRTSIRIYGEGFRLLSDGTNFYTANRQRRVLVSLTTVATAVANVSHTGLTDTEINDYELRYSGLKQSAADLIALTVSQGGSFSIGNTVAFISTYTNADGSVQTGGVNTDSQALSEGGGGGTANAIRGGIIRMYGGLQGGPGVFINWANTSTANVNGRSYTDTRVWTTLTSTTPIDGLRLALLNGSNITAGVFALYGMRG